MQIKHSKGTWITRDLHNMVIVAQEAIKHFNSNPMLICVSTNGKVSVTHNCATRFMSGSILPMFYCLPETYNEIKMLNGRLLSQRHLRQQDYYIYSLVNVKYQGEKNWLRNFNIYVQSMKERFGNNILVAVTN